ncbi:GNAT family protein [Virgisporangium ochraceum]|uniref:Succinyl-CoA transferase Rv0802c n=1 Tax=Virgisporangium ochraceum TaxID=65505 RepID=A0A8J3ZUD5_9ACTN|nr:GNAT family protein [Virgisporangium ochraceum]GIJ67670.1 succinyl-CoA transferase Rv0802c [Virgisporangium ochraceum]
MPLADLWPVLGVGVRTPLVELFVPDGDALEPLARLAADGIYDPQNQYLPRIPVGGWEDVASPEAERRFLRYFWAAFADWRPEKWNLMLAARVDGDLVGVQEIGAQHFAVTRTVSTGSWVGRRFQGAGHGKAMREAVLHLAFDGLDAERADTAAWTTNHASLGVSRAMGYRDNGTTTRAAEGRRVEQVNLTLRRADWTRSSRGCAVTGLSPETAAMFGL